MERKLVKRRRSPGGVIQCNPCGWFVSRRRYNSALRFGQIPTCGKCGSPDLTMTRAYEIRSRRLIWTNKGARRGNTAQRGTRAAGK